MQLATQNSKLKTQNLKLKTWQWHGLALLFFVALTIWMTGGVWSNVGRSIEGWGDALLQVWTLDWTAHALATDPFSLWNANAFYPYNNSLAFSETLFGQGILVAPLIWLTDNPVLAYNLLLLASFILSGWGMYLLVAHLTGRKEAGLIAGVIFAFFPHRFGQMSHLHLLATQWLPFCLLYLRCFLKWRHKGDLALFGLFFVLQALSSTYLGLFMVIAVGLYLLWSLVPSLKSVVPSREKVKGRKTKAEGQEKSEVRSKKAEVNTQSSVLSPQSLASSIVNRQSSILVPLLICLVLVGLVLLPFYWPYLTVQNELGFERSPAEVASFSAQPFYYLDVPKENKLNQWLLQPLTKNLGWWDSSRGGERGLYLGTIASILAIVGAVVAWRRRKQDSDGLFYVLLAVVAIIFTFGPAWNTGRFGTIPLPYALLYNYVPGFAGLRVPVRFIYIVALAVAVLAGYAVAWLMARLKLAGWRRGLLAVPIVALLCFEYVSDVAIVDSNVLRAATPPANAWLAQHPGIVLNVPLSGSDNSNLFYQYWSRAGWQPVMNGFSGFMPPAYDSLKRAWAAEWPSQRLVDLLQGLEVRWLVINSDDDAVKPNWAKTQANMAKFPAVALAQQFGSTFIYEIKPNPWARQLSATIKPDDPLYFVEYRRNDPQLIELIAYYLERAKVTKSESVFGQLNLGFKPLGALPIGRPAEFLFLQAGEDPTLYGFRPQDKFLANSLLTVYRKSGDLLARYDFSRRDEVGALAGKVKRVEVRDNKLEFSGGGMGAPPGGQGYFVRLAFASTQPQQIELKSGATNSRLSLEAGVTAYEVNLDAGGAIEWSGGNPAVVWAELWRGNAPQAGQAQLRRDVVLIEAQARADGANGVATVKLVPKGGANNDYTATLDVYNYPWGAHPQGHYGYWSVAVNGSGGAELEYNLNLARKEMKTRLNGGDVPNYPPDPQSLDITKYGKLGDFRASFTLYAGDKLIGSIRLFDFTVRAVGDKNDPNNLRASDFKGYTTGLSFLVLPPEKGSRVGG